jgi:hypothetical protein
MHEPMSVMPCVHNVLLPITRKREKTNVDALSLSLLAC